VRATVASPIPPPNFRYVGLAAGPDAWRSRLMGWSTFLGVTSVGVSWLGGTIPSLLGSSVVGALLAWGMMQMGGPKMAIKGGQKPTEMAIVPWGVILEPHAEHSRVLRWAGIKNIEVDYVHTRDASGTPSTLWSMVWVLTSSQECFVGRAVGAVGLERLLAHLPAYAEESAATIALDWQGEEVLEDMWLDPAFPVLLRRAKAFLHSASAMMELELPEGLYRQGARLEVSKGTEFVLRSLLRRPGGSVDRRAFAALLAGEVGAVGVLPELLAMVTSVHPIVAGAAKAAALKLGGERSRVGAVEELSSFLLPEDIAALDSWAQGE
jgi:hypothetical protein